MTRACVANPKSTQVAQCGEGRKISKDTLQRPKENQRRIYSSETSVRMGQRVFKHVCHEYWRHLLSVPNPLEVFGKRWEAEVTLKCISSCLTTNWKWTYSWTFRYVKSRVAINLVWAASKCIGGVQGYGLVNQRDTSPVGGWSETTPL